MGQLRLLRFPVRARRIAGVEYVRKDDLLLYLEAQAQTLREDGQPREGELLASVASSLRRVRTT